ncbi:hypothetical protein MXD62_19290, partial [Frankia sp. Mgl5]|uniref:hypothetical protein n=1 Tax=Frankia sp. Mgl5 TaxID=2933793 RepID=UPI00200E4FF8
TLGDTDRDAIATALVTAIGDGDYSPRGMADAAVRVVNRILAGRASASPFVTGDGQGETAGPDGDECRADCVCRAGWTEPGQ